MLEVLHRHIARGPPIYGMNFGSVAFLMNEYGETDLPARIAAAERAVLHPLTMRTRDAVGVESEALAINEVSLLRQSRQTAKLRISIDGRGAPGRVDLRRGAGGHARGIVGLQPSPPTGRSSL